MLPHHEISSSSQALMTWHPCDCLDLFLWCHNTPSMCPTIIPTPESVPFPLCFLKTVSFFSSSYLFLSTPWLVSLHWLCRTPPLKTNRNIQFLVTYRNFKGESTMLFSICHHTYTKLQSWMTIFLTHWLLFTGSLLNSEFNSKSFCSHTGLE